MASDVKAKRELVKRLREHAESSDTMARNRAMRDAIACIEATLPPVKTPGTVLRETLNRCQLKVFPTEPLQDSVSDAILEGRLGTAAAILGIKGDE